MILIEYTPQVYIFVSEKSWLEDYFSFWEGLFSGAMLNFQGVYEIPWEIDNQVMLCICAAKTDMLDMKACHDSNTQNA